MKCEDQSLSTVSKTNLIFHKDGESHKFPPLSQHSRRKCESEGRRLFLPKTKAQVRTVVFKIQFNLPYVYIRNSFTKFYK